MKKLLCILWVVSLSLTLYGVPASGELPSKDVVSKSFKAIVTIFSFYSNKTGGVLRTRGKGVIYKTSYNHSYIVTAAHVVEPSIIDEDGGVVYYRYCMVYFNDGLVREGYIVKEDDKHDIASLDVPFSSWEPSTGVGKVEFGSIYFGFNFVIKYWEDISSKPDFFSFISIFSSHLVVARGASGLLVFLQGEVPFIIPGGIREGTSGSGVFDKEGRVVGVISASNFYFGEFAPINDFLKES